ncbi:DinB family protein [Virgibacillus sp. C22-A2]|uniref:DinB family protein n=1 Tax=Virgibacillus tibetensis TaxID=3042313 RepID=A0ABU6KD03_9BACI|nr:DinB family protein [Virgibacillus sp. C22-A2]
MSNVLLKQFAFTRNALLSELEKIDAELVDVQPDVFNNTIHWQVGHILTAAEQFLFGFPSKTQHLPENYPALFGYGTKPSDWPSEVPSVAELTEQLRDQLKRVMQIPEEQFEVKLDKAFLGQETFGGLATLAVFHEANHSGQIHSMSLVVKRTN